MVCSVLVLTGSHRILPVALFIFAFTGGYKWVHWIGPCVGGALFGLAMLLVYVSANSVSYDITLQVNFR